MEKTRSEVREVVSICGLIKDAGFHSEGGGKPMRLLLEHRHTNPLSFFVCF